MLSLSISLNSKSNRLGDIPEPFDQCEGVLAGKARGEQMADPVTTDFLARAERYAAHLTARFGRSGIYFLRALNAGENIWRGVPGFRSDIYS
jgi:hypothetical protein